MKFYYFSYNFIHVNYYDSEIQKGNDLLKISIIVFMVSVVSYCNSLSVLPDNFSKDFAIAPILSTGEDSTLVSTYSKQFTLQKNQSLQMFQNEKDSLLAYYTDSLNILRRNLIEVLYRALYSSITDDYDEAGSIFAKYIYEIFAGSIFNPEPDLRNPVNKADTTMNMDNIAAIKSTSTDDVRNDIADKYQEIADSLSDRVNDSVDSLREFIYTQVEEYHD